VYFQTMDDKARCVGLYKDGKLIFDPAEIPHSLDGMRTWTYSGTLAGSDVDFGWLVANGQSLAEACPEELTPPFVRAAAKMRAFRRSFEIAKINFNDHCFFELVPHDFLLQFLQLKNQITEHVFENMEKPPNYEFLKRAHQVLHKITYQTLYVNGEGCRALFTRSVHRSLANKALQGPQTIDYNLFGTITGRLATYRDSFPILTMHRELRQLIKPHNNWFLSMDYNGAELRTALALSGLKQPDYDVHEWNMEHVFKDRGPMSRETAKTLFFSWLYNPDSRALDGEVYKRTEILKNHYDGEYITTSFGRKIKVDNRRAFNYIIQSTTADLVIDRAVKIDEYLKDYKSFVSHLVHDEIVIDLATDEQYLVPQLRDLFKSNKLDDFMVNLKAGKDYYNLEKFAL